jgi:hypothetical protein
MIEGLLEPTSPGVVYDIRNDAVLLAQISEASLSSGNLGLALEHGVVGSPTWWAAVKAGQVNIVTFTGEILRVDGGPMGDVPTVRIGGKGEIKSWVAWEGFKSDLVGKPVEVCYARVPPKRPPRPGFVVELILQVRTLGSGRPANEPRSASSPT